METADGSERVELVLQDSLQCDPTQSCKTLGIFVVLFYNLIIQSSNMNRMLCHYVNILGTPT